MRFAIVAGAALLALVACSADGGSFGQCSEPEIKIRELDGRNARNSVSDCEIELDPYAPYTVAILAQELWEWHYKRRTGRSIGTREEVASHEREVQAAAALWRSVEAREYRAREAWEMLRSGSYDFRDDGWTQAEIAAAMAVESEDARADVDGYMPTLLEARERLIAWRAAR